MNAADFFSNHPFHIRMQEFSRRLWAPAQQGAQRETKWFYERARGQYADEQSKLTPSEQKRFKSENPKAQMFTKTDLAKFENVWDDHPKWVNLGGQKNFARYASRIGKEWTTSPDGFNELYYRRAIARALVFRAAEKLVSEQSWYNGGYRANIVAYALAAVGEVCRRHGKSVDFQAIWNFQALSQPLLDALAEASAFVNEDITHPPQGISNISEWAKKDACWTRIQARIGDLESRLSEKFSAEMVSLSEHKQEVRAAKKTQKVDNGINAQVRVVEIGADVWAKILWDKGMRKKLTAREIGILRVAEKIPARIPTDRQCSVLLEILEKAQSEGLTIA